MADEIPTPHRGKLSPGLARWVEGAPAGERRSAVVRPRMGSVPDQAVERVVAEIEAAGATVESAGAGAVTVVVTPESLARLCRLAWVAAIDEPRILDPKSRFGAG